MVDQLLPEAPSVGFVHGEDPDRRSPYGRFPDKHRSNPPEVSFPNVAPRIKEARELVCLRVDSREICPFVEVTAQARMSKVVEQIAPPVLLGDDVLGVKRGLDVDLGKVAVFTNARGPLPHRFLGFLIHPWNLGGAVS